MLAIIMAASLAVPTAEDVQAASNKLRGNSALALSNLQHAAPLFACVNKEMKTLTPPASTDAQQQYHWYMKQMSASAERCGAENERGFWTASLKKVYPDWTDELAKAVAADSLSFFIFDSAISVP